MSEASGALDSEATANKGRGEEADPNVVKSTAAVEAHGIAARSLETNVPEGEGPPVAFAFIK